MEMEPRNLVQYPTGAAYAAARSSVAEPEPRGFKAQLRVDRTLQAEVAVLATWAAVILGTYLFGAVR